VSAAAPGFRCIGVVATRGYGDVVDTLRRVRALADARGIELLVEPGAESLLPGAGPLRIEDIDLLITLGGDGTLLRGARMVSLLGMPVLGINLGYLVFFTSISLPELDGHLESVLDGDYWVDERFTLEAVVVNADGTAGTPFLALNDAVLHKGGF